MARELGASMNAAAPDEVLPGEQQAGRVGKALGAVSRAGARRHLGRPYSMECSSFTPLPVKWI